MWKVVASGVVALAVFVFMMTNLSSGPMGSGSRWTVSTVAVPDDVARAALEREVGVAKALGFEEDFREERQVRESWYHRLEVDKQECVAVVATASGPGQLSSLSLLDADGQVARDDGPRPVMHVQGCFERGGEYEVRAPLAWGSDLPERTVRVVVLRAPLATIGGNEKLNRGWVPLAP